MKKNSLICRDAAACEAAGRVPVTGCLFPELFDGSAAVASESGKVSAAARGQWRWGLVAVYAVGAVLLLLHLKNYL